MTEYPSAPTIDLDTLLTKKKHTLNRNDLEGQGQSTSFLTASEKILRYTFFANMTILELSYGQPRFRIKKN